MNTSFVKIRESLERMSQAERSAAQFILGQPQTCMNMSIQELASRSYVSSTAIIRMCKRLGFEGFKDFKQYLISENTRVESAFKEYDEVVTCDDSIYDIVQKVTAKNMRVIQDTTRLIDARVIETVVKKIHKAQRVFLFSFGANYVVARDLYRKLLRVHKDTVLIEDAYLQLLNAEIAGPEDLAMIISYSGFTSEMVQCTDSLKENNVPIISITRISDSPIAKVSDIVLLTSVEEVKLHTSDMAIRMAQLNIIDIIYTAYTTMIHETPSLYPESRRK